ncbi:MAG: ATP-binding protein, partial [Dehalococcoidia bacterium]
MTDAAPAGETASRGHNLPAEVASFVGRGRELAAISADLRSTRLLTLMGTGGSGKTRLALRVAGELMQSYPDGVWLVQFASLGDSSLVDRVVAAALGVSGSPDQPLLATLAMALGNRELLLVLDNCEHVIGACARLAETLLRACPRLQILATSREPLHIHGEVVWRVPSLALPEAGSLPSLEALARVEAVALFLDRARARQPDFRLTPHNAASVAAICRRLDGLPLGIELAAAQLRALAPEQIASRLDDALRLLGNGSRTLARHETLRAALDWSYALLSADEQLLFRRLSVFNGGFDVEAAEGVCSGDGIAPVDVLGLLTALIDKSLVEPQLEARVVRCRLLEPVRQYARALLTVEQAAELQRRHARCMLELCEAAEPWLRSGDRDEWVERLAADQENLRAALLWSRQRSDTAELELGLRVIGAMFWFWGFHGAVSEGLGWAEAALARGAMAGPAVRAKALHAAGELTWLAGQDALARQRLEESAILWRELGDGRELAYTLQVLALLLPPTEGLAA